MNIKLEEFVKEYICMEQDIQIEDLKESIMQYGRMRSKIESTMEEIEELKKIDEVAYVRFASVYQQFADVESFFTELKKLMGDRKEPQK